MLSERVYDQRRERDAIQRCRSERTEVVLQAPPTSLRTERPAKRRLQLRCAAGDRHERLFPPAQGAVDGANRLAPASLGELNPSRCR